VSKQVCERAQSNTRTLMSEDQVRWYGFQLASALEHVHSMGVIHRDVKSENVFVMRNDVLKLGDFGLASVLTPGTASVTPGAVGTPFYMAPELLKGERCVLC
jgi:serine/threonine protein kinase